ncbi:MAG: hypothetical protein ACK4Z4_18625 [Ferrovibrio sp.]|jgi:hypothetical protein
MSDSVAPHAVPRAYRIALVAVGLPLAIGTFLQLGGVWSPGRLTFPLLTPFFIMLAVQMILWTTSGNLNARTNRLFGTIFLMLFALIALISIIEFVSE